MAWTSINQTMPWVFLPPLFREPGKLYCMPPDFLQDCQLVHSFNDFHSILNSQEISQPALIAVDKRWHAQLMWHFECVKYLDLSYGLCIFLLFAKSTAPLSVA